MPYLVCDPMPAEVTEYEVDMDGTPEASMPEDLGNGTVRLHYDVSGVSAGNHTVMVRAKYGSWGWSLPTAPFDFTKPTVMTPIGLGLEG